MSTILNALVCDDGGNTGIDGCSHDIVNISGMFLADPGFKIAASALTSNAAYIAALKAATLAPVGSRIYPIHNIVQDSDKTEDSKIQTRADGSMVKIRSGFSGAVYELKKGGSKMWEKINAFNGHDVSILLYDRAGSTIGGTNTAGDQVFVDQNLFDVKTPKFNDGSSKIKANTFEINADPAFFAKPGIMWNVPISDLLSVVGLRDITLYSGGARSAGVSLIKGMIGTTNADLWTLYASILAGSTALWIAKDSVSGLVIPVATVVTNTTIGGWTVTVDITHANYNSANPVIWSLTTAALLNTAGILSAANEPSIPFVTPN